jgi:hypothetical protein
MLNAMHSSLSQTVRALNTAAAAAVLLGLAAPLGAQGAVDPNVAPRAAELERIGERQLGTEMLGRYLAVAQSDGRAWFLLARFYRLDARDWHRSGHRTSPDAELYLALSDVAIEEAAKLEVDSAPLYGALVAVDRALVTIEEQGWAHIAGSSVLPPLPPLVLELGRNLVANCPRSGVILAGSELEGVAVWYGVMGVGGRGDLLPVRPDLYAIDGRYRTQTARALGVSDSLGIRPALAAASAARAICLTPNADSTLLPDEQPRIERLVRIIGPGEVPANAGLGFTQLVLDQQTGSSVWSRDVLTVYGVASRRNPLLCRSLASVAGVLPGGACRP